MIAAAITLPPGIRTLRTSERKQEAARTGAFTGSTLVSRGRLVKRDVGFSEIPEEGRVNGMGVRGGGGDASFQAVKEGC